MSNFICDFFKNWNFSKRFFALKEAIELKFDDIVAKENRFSFQNIYFKS